MDNKNITPSPQQFFFFKCFKNVLGDTVSDYARWFFSNHGWITLFPRRQTGLPVMLLLNLLEQFSQTVPSVPVLLAAIEPTICSTWREIVYICLADCLADCLLPHIRHVLMSSKAPVFVKRDDLQYRTGVVRFANLHYPIVRLTSLFSVVITESAVRRHVTQCDAAWRNHRQASLPLMWLLMKHEVDAMALPLGDCDDNGDGDDDSWLW